MAQSSFFIGLVSYEKTSFPSSQGPEGLVASLSDAITDAGLPCLTQVNVSNFFDEEPFALTAAMSRASVREEIRLESAWYRFLHGKPGWRNSVRVAGRYASFYLNWRKNSQDRELRRLLNIEYSHVDLYRSAVASGAQWAIILEDDAATVQLADLVSGLIGLCKSDSKAKMINLSESFSLEKIGVKQLLTPSVFVTWDGSAVRVIFESEKPVTNTVCAIAFRTDFLAAVLADFDSHASGPVVPIDWKLNASLMRLWCEGEIGAGECWFIEPGPVLQLSMHQDKLGE